MNTTIEKVFEELGRLHVQSAIQQQYIAKLEQELAIERAKQVPVSTPATPSA